MSNDIAIQINNLKKMYKLGQIGGGTLQGDLQSWWARIRGKEDPNSKIGSDQRSNGKTFMALNGINLTVHKGEALGIIGGNGAGKSTMLKILSRVTAPTAGEVCINGRIASMLEVGTGFNGEMTGRENIYMNGAILGMTKAEVDSKMEQIIDFSECREFIDTPVKRYSSGMYVKLAFSVAAHLDAEIMIMDEVLAVGDMAFQKKCLTKMKEAAAQEGRTVLYVSHNMNTIRQLCDRCVVLHQGKVIFDGDVEAAIEIYLNSSNLMPTPVVCLDEIKRPKYSFGLAHMSNITFLNTQNCIFNHRTSIEFELTWNSSKDLNNVGFRALILNSDGSPVGLAMTDKLGSSINGQANTSRIACNFAGLVEGKYLLTLSLYQSDSLGNSIILDTVEKACAFEIIGANTEQAAINWPSSAWGSIRFPDMIVK